MKKLLLYSAVAIIALIICFRPAGFINTKGDGKIDIDFERAEITVFAIEKTGETDYFEQEIKEPDNISEIIKSLKPIEYVESMAETRRYKIDINDGESYFEVMLYDNRKASAKKVDKDGNSEWMWEYEIPDMYKIEEIFR